MPTTIYDFLAAPRSVVFRYKNVAVTDIVGAGQGYQNSERNHNGKLKGRILTFLMLQEPQDHQTLESPISI